MTHNSLMTKQIQISSKILIKIAINSSNIKTSKKLSTRSDDDKRSHVRIFKPRYEYRLLISYSLLWLIKLKNLLSLWNLSTAAKSQTSSILSVKKYLKISLMNHVLLPLNRQLNDGFNYIKLSMKGHLKSDAGEEMSSKIEFQSQQKSA